MQSEQRWSQWKADGCTSIVRNVEEADRLTVRPAELKPIRRRYRPKPYPGRAQLESLYSNWKGGDTFLKELAQETKPTPTLRDILSQLNDLDGSDRNGLKETFSWISQRALLRDALSIHSSMKSHDTLPSSLDIEPYLVPVFGEDAVLSRKEEQRVDVEGEEEEEEIQSGPAMEIDDMSS